MPWNLKAGNKLTCLTVLAIWGIPALLVVGVVATFVLVVPFLVATDLG